MGTPFPWLPMLAIAIGLVSHSYALTSLFPYVGYMVQHLGVTHDKDEAGYYAGYVSSAFMVGRFGSSYFWGRFADTHGRLPVIYVGLGSMVVLSVAFGLSTTFLQALVCRFLLGMTNGLLGISKTMISEVCGKEHEVVGMASILGCGSIGLVIGPGLGGLLAEPATHYPTVFSETGLFGRQVSFPYLLPNMVGASLALTGLPMVFFFLKETKHLHSAKNEGRTSRKGVLSVALQNFLPICDAIESLDTAADEGAMLEMLPLRKAESLEADGGNDSGNGGATTDGHPTESRLEKTKSAEHDGDVAAGRGTGRVGNGEVSGDGYDGVGVDDIGGDHVDDSDEENQRLLMDSRRVDGGASNAQPSDLEKGGATRRSVDGNKFRRDNGAGEQFLLTRVPRADKAAQGETYPRRHVRVCRLFVCHDWIS
ncbi:unnamed protein product [Scytosiphon promiscuus]